MYARHGRELLGLKSPVRRTGLCMSIDKVLDEGNCVSATRGAKPEIKTVILRKERAYKANGPDELAQHTDVHGSGSGFFEKMFRLHS